MIDQINFIQLNMSLKNFLLNLILSIKKRTWNVEVGSKSNVKVVFRFQFFKLINIRALIVDIYFKLLSSLFLFLFHFPSSKNKQ